MKAQPYIGATGFRNADQIRAAETVAHNLGLSNDNDCTLMLGFLTSAKRMLAKDVAGKRGPAMNDLGSLLDNVCQDFLPALHYAPDKDRLLGDQLIDLLSLPGVYPVCKMVQINTAWPDPGEMARVQQYFPDVQYVVQLPQAVVNNESAGAIGERVKEYAGVTQHIFIDPSGGKGLYLTPQVWMNRYADVYNAVSRTGACIGVAGGLDGESVDGFIAEVRKYTSTPCFIDAEGKLMTDNELDGEKVKSYLTNATAAWRREFSK